MDRFNQKIKVQSMEEMQENKKTNKKVQKVEDSYEIFVISDKKFIRSFLHVLCDEILIKSESKKCTQGIFFFNISAVNIELLNNTGQVSFQFFKLSSQDNECCFIFSPKYDPQKMLQKLRELCKLDTNDSLSALDKRNHFSYVKNAVSYIESRKEPLKRTIKRTESLFSRSSSCEKMFNSDTKEKKHQIKLNKDSPDVESWLKETVLNIVSDNEQNISTCVNLVIRKNLLECKKKQILGNYDTYENEVHSIGGVNTIKKKKIKIEKKLQEVYEKIQEREKSAENVKTDKKELYAKRVIQMIEQRSSSDLSTLNEMQNKIGKFFGGKKKNKKIALKPTRSKKNDA